jgi:hypothetical protein
VTHFIRKNDSKISKYLLNLRTIESHVEEEQASCVFSLLKDYDIFFKLEIIIEDNSTTNDVLCRTISKLFNTKKDLL